jgi:DNA-binding transcriptional regulator YiaG
MYKKSNHAMDNEVPNTEEFVEEKDLKQQDLTNDEMDQIRQQLEMMNKSNNIVASNS